MGSKSGFGVVAQVGQLEEPGERFVEVGAVAGRLGVEVFLAQLAQPVEAVALGVGLAVGGHDAQFGAGLGVQHKPPAEMAQTRRFRDSSLPRGRKMGRLPH